MSIDKKRGLGKGMGSLLSGFDIDEEIEGPVRTAPPIQEVKIKEVKREKPKTVAKISEKLSPADKENSVLLIDISRITPNLKQPRKAFDTEKLEELATSVKEQGIIQPLIVEELSDGKFLIIAGERRYRAAEIAGVKKVPVIVRTLTELQKIEASLVENIQRENLNPIEEASAIQYLIEKSGMTQEEVAAKVGKSRSAVANAIRLLVLPDEFKDEIISGVLTAGHARAILSCQNPSDRKLLRDKIIEGDLSVRAAENLASQYNKGQKIVLKKNVKEESELGDIIDKFITAVGTKCEIKGTLDRGKLQIKYRTVRDLERIYSLLSGGGVLFNE